MKRLFGALIGALTMCAAFAQTVEKDEAAIVYYSPKTVVNVDLTYTVEKHEPGIYADFAESLLGITDAAVVRTVYTLQDVKISTGVETDYSRPHKVRFDAGIPMLLSMNEKNLLVGYNVPAESKTTANKNKKERAPKTSTIPVVPFSEDVVKAGSIEEKAAAVANQIFHLREMRTYLLSGEVEHMPADGKATQVMLDEIAKEEEALVKLFTGHQSSYELKKRFSFIPEAANDTTLSLHTYSDSEIPDTITAKILLVPQKYAEKEELAEPSKGKKKADEPALSPIVYNLPAQCNLVVLNQFGMIAERMIQIAQLGIDVPLPMSLFDGKELPVIRFNEKTGNVISISK